jgi:hypothetical protein
MLFMTKGVDLMIIKFIEDCASSLYREWKAAWFGVLIFAIAGSMFAWNKFGLYYTEAILDPIFAAWWIIATIRGNKRS